MLNWLCNILMKHGQTSVSILYQFLEVYRRLAAAAAEPDNPVQLPASKLAKQVITRKMGE